jgi:hypothetical protein
MKEYFELDAKEKRLKWILLLLFILLASTIGAGVYFQSHHINHDRLLVPALFFICGAFFLLFGRNGLMKGNLIQKWTPFYLFDLLQFVVVRLGKVPKERAKTIVGRMLGVGGLLVAAICFSFALWDIVKP